MTLTRFTDWPERLGAYVYAREQRPFAWGKSSHDCCSFANGAVIAMTGADLMADIPDYADEAAARSLLAGGLAELIDARLGRLKSKGLAQRGDLALAELRGVQTVCIVEGERIVGPGARGLERLPRKLVIAAWAV